MTRARMAARGDGPVAALGSEVEAAAAGCGVAGRAWRDGTAQGIGVTRRSSAWRPRRGGRRHRAEEQPVACHDLAARRTGYGVAVLVA
jgi:hypothetical protein